ncbi:MAG: diaminopimelate epimerase [Myxococcales bacterium]|nr:diaminopimelate epimerase [Myxococcales bacterium]
MSMWLRFRKFQGLGNDFIVVDARGDNHLMSEKIASRLCCRRTGIGADGVLTVLRPNGDADARMHIYNADGSVPEMCGNGLRCVVLALAEASRSEPLSVETGAGLMKGWLTADGEVRVTLGYGRVLHPSVPVYVDAMSTTGVEVDIGNPHLVLFAEQPGWRSQSLTALADTYGPELEYHSRFPERVNVGFARMTEDHKRIDLVVFERGAGRTMACGTGAAACALAARRTQRLAAGVDEVEVRLPGGPVKITLPLTDADPALLTGAAEEVFVGEVRLEEA